MGFLSALAFLTVFPVPGKLPGGVETMPKAVKWFPVVGALIGAFAAGVAFLAFRFCPAPVAAVLAVLALAVAQGGLHLDGLADTCDGFLSHRPRARVLEIMKDPHIGTFGVLGLVFILALQFAAVFSLPAERRLLAVLLAPALGRAAIAPMLALLPAARPGGLGEMFAPGGRSPGVTRAALCGALVFALPFVAFGPCVGARVALGAGTVWCLFAAICRTKIGGYTGDTLGGASELVETTVLLLAA